MSRKDHSLYDNLTEQAINRSGKEEERRLESKFPPPNTSTLRLHVHLNISVDFWSNPNTQQP